MSHLRTRLSLAAAFAAALLLPFCSPVHASAAPTPAPTAQAFGSGKPLPLRGRVLLQKLREHFPRMPVITQRKALAVITDFSNAKLEDWTGPGFNDTGDIRATLDLMETHWAWLSHGREDIDWDIIRVTLPVPLAPDAFGGWPEFRNTVAALVRAQVDIADYDANRDGIIDSVWVIASSQGQEFDYLIGGTSSNGGVNLFVDTQANLAVTSNAYGNFNHELAHTFGVPDLYGEFDTQHYLTLMSDSWPVPPQDFTAYERTLLGWAQPRLLGAGTHRVELRVATRSFDVVRIDTGRPGEFFLIEYRRRPDEGFSSVAPPYDGLTVFHLQEGSNQNVDPPLMKLEPADGQINPNQAPDLTDFFYPGNPAMELPYRLHSYFAGLPVAEITNVQWAGSDRIAVDIRVLPALAPVLGNLLVRNRLENPSFERGDGSGGPAAWFPDAFFFGTSIFDWDSGTAFRGQRSASITSPTPNDARWIQTYGNLVPGRGYQFCGRLRGRDVATTPFATIGANVSVLGGFELSRSLSGTFDWTQACVVHEAATPTATYACRLGFYGSEVRGKLWCDDMSLVPLRSAFP
ncbi:MAG: carbohydrate-binding, CenC-like protein [Moraxellaceae bacterium]|jgi:hypothetical protein|nr:carbohydrate-binding, CenC-like protein [Moraxellaceae bacterium]